MSRIVIVTLIYHRHKPIHLLDYMDVLSIKKIGDQLAVMKHARFVRLLEVAYRVSWRMPEQYLNMGQMCCFFLNSLTIKHILTFLLNLPNLYSRL
jgi:hypothetical protein